MMMMMMTKFRSFLFAFLSILLIFHWVLLAVTHFWLTKLFGSHWSHIDVYLEHIVISTADFSTLTIRKMDIDETPEFWAFVTRMMAVTQIQFLQWTMLKLKAKLRNFSQLNVVPLFTHNFCAKPSRVSEATLESLMFENLTSEENFVL